VQTGGAKLGRDDRRTQRREIRCDHGCHRHYAGKKTGGLLHDPLRRNTGVIYRGKRHVAAASDGANHTIKLNDDDKEIQAAIAPLKAALKGKTIGIASGTVYTPFIDKYFKDVADIREYSNSADAILDLQAERIDAVFDDITFANTTLARPENSNLNFSGPQLSGPIWGEGEAMGVRHADADLKAKLDTAIQAALADGTVKKLSEKWFKSDVTP
jgi:octopine/nopaline transport system substrate-binding protein